MENIRHLLHAGDLVSHVQRGGADLLRSDFCFTVTGLVGSDVKRLGEIR